MSQRLLQDFYDGEKASRQGEPIAANPHMPHTQPERFDAWVAGWLEEEGPSFVVSPKGRSVLSRAYLGKIGALWPRTVAR
jgi:hypothetical protein